MSLIIPTGTRIWIGGHDRAARAAVEPLLADTMRPPDGPIDRFIVTPLAADEALYFAEKNLSRLVEKGELWLVASEENPTPPREAFAESMPAMGLKQEAQVRIDAGYVIAIWRRKVTPPPARPPV